ncbi:MAG: hypothetical protein PHE83_16795, partial [Opitutaceae bacterium]|nr:hypothetical protein [Opitutaceae bacterium]
PPYKGGRYKGEELVELARLLDDCKEALQQANETPTPHLAKLLAQVAAARAKIESFRAPPAEESGKTPA